MIGIPFDSKFKNLNGKLVIAEVKFDQNNQTFVRTYYGQFTISKNNDVIEILHDSNRHPLFPHSFMQDFKIQILKPGAVMILNTEKYDVHKNVIEEDQIFIHSLNFESLIEYSNNESKQNANIKYKSERDFTSIYPLSKMDDNNILATLNYLMNSNYIKERNEFNIDKEVVLTELKYADFPEFEAIKRSINITFAFTGWDTENTATANLIYNINTPNDIGIIAIYEQNIGSNSFPVGYKVKVICSNGHFYIFHPDERGLISGYNHKIISRLNNYSIQELLKQ